MEEPSATLPAGQTHETRCADNTSNLTLADRCLDSGHRVRNPFAHYLGYALLIENSADQIKQDNQQLQEITT